MIMKEYDAIVVGARVAGSTVAAILGEAGYRVLLVDRASFPSTTLSTHYFRGAHAVTVLRQLGVLDIVLALGAPPLTRQFSYVRGTDEMLIGPPQEPGEIGYSLSVRRESLDNVLVKRAIAAGVTVAERARLVDLLHEEERVVGVRLATTNGEDVVRARVVVGADGRHSTIAQLVDAPLEESDQPCRAIYYRYLRHCASPDGLPTNGAEFSFLGDEVAYIFPSDDGVTCVALSINLEDFAWIRQSLEVRFAERVALHKGIAARVAASTPVGPLLGCGPEPSYVRIPAGPGWALVGDAGLHQDPWSGNGIDAAMVHATFLADALRQWFSGVTTEESAMARYHEQRNEHGLEKYRVTMRLARDLRQLTA